NPKHTILVVDDTPENLKLLTEMLTDQNYRVRIAPNGEHALASIQKEMPDLILLDILMPEMDGFQLCRLIKADEYLRDIPVIFISALDEVFDKVMAFSIGGVDYVTKPFQVEEVLARVHTHLSLREMRQELYFQNQDLEAFAHTVAHDLKTPLSTLMGFQELLTMEATDFNDEQRSLLDNSMQSAQRMLNIIDELLLFASVRMEQIEIVPVDMESVVEQALARLAQLINYSHTEIIKHESLPHAIGYAPWFVEVWVNYISNGLKYGGQPPVLELGATSDELDGITRFWVRDNGKGMSQEDQAKLFTEFTRLDTVRAQGHGLGLSIVRRIIEKLGGQVGVESRISQGSVFYFTAPTFRERPAETS
ncbi:MAG: response regulator, partial [Anaerolineae bacterium]|nr:response regulator [Anaerolineae bacterium]